jgi:putative hydrolase of the HAD superfamily
MTPKGVFFDLMGTLLIPGEMPPAWSDRFPHLCAYLRERGLSVSAVIIEQTCDRFLMGEEPPARDDGLTIFERRIQALCCDLGVQTTSAAIRRIAAEGVDAWQKRLLLDPNCVPVLKALQHRKTLALVSNFDHPPWVHALVRRLSLDTYFATIVVSGEVGVKKPDPAIFRLALQRTGLRPEETVYVGDTDEDVTGSLAAGIAPILIRRDQPAQNESPSGGRSVGADIGATSPAVRTIGSLSELVALVA